MVHLSGWHGVLKMEEFNRSADRGWKAMGLASIVWIVWLSAAAMGTEPAVLATGAAEGLGQGEPVLLTDAPNVPPPIKRTGPAKVIVDLEVREATKRLSDGVEYTFWTFGGEVPGKFIRIRQNDKVQFNLHNHPTNRFPHNIDLHAVTGPGGGAASSFTAPGKTSTFSFQAINPGLYIYHCASPPVGMHIANGMYGLILVEPEGGLPPVDREFYIVQSEFYTPGKFGDKGLQPFDQGHAIDERPNYVVFNGEVGALTGDKSLKAKVGETVRIYFGNGGPNLTSSFHLIGEVFDRVYQEGGTNLAHYNVGTTLIPAGGTAIVEFKFDVPGTYILVDHAIFRAFNKGTIGMIEVEGPANMMVYSGKQQEVAYQPADSAVSLVASPPTTVIGGPVDKHSKIENGSKIYTSICFACHQNNGQGLPPVFPPLAKSDYLMADKKRAIRGIISGQQGEITVNGMKYNGIMPPVALNDQQVADVLTFVLNSWGNDGSEISADDVRRIRATLPAAPAPVAAPVAPVAPIAPAAQER